MEVGLHKVDIIKDYSCIPIQRRQASKNVAFLRPFRLLNGIHEWDSLAFEELPNQVFQPTGLVTFVKVNLVIAVAVAMRDPLDGGTFGGCM